MSQRKDLRIRFLALITLLSASIMIGLTPVENTFAAEPLSANEYFKTVLCPEKLKANPTGWSLEWSLCNKPVYSYGEILSLDPRGPSSWAINCQDRLVISPKYSELANKDGNVYDSTTASLPHLNDLLLDSIRLLCVYPQPCVPEGGHAGPTFETPMVGSWDKSAGQCTFKLYNPDDRGKELINNLTSRDNDCFFLTESFPLLATAIHDRCSLLNRDDKAKCEEIQRKYPLCVNKLNELEKATHGETPVTSPEEDIKLPPGDGLANNLTMAQFEEMSLYARYISTVLDSCTRDGQSYCQLDDLQKKRLATLIGLTQYGSINYASASKITSGISIMPEEHYLFTTITDKYYISEDEITPESHYQVACFTASKLNSILRVSGSSMPDINYGICVFDSQNTSIHGANNLINLCKADSCEKITSCRSIIGERDSAGLLSTYKTQPMFLQTLFWNIIDIKDKVNNDYSYINWKPLSSSEKDAIQKVLNNPDKSQIRACKIDPTLNTAVTSQNRDFVCQVEGGLGWTLCGTAKPLLDGFDWGYNILSSIMGIKSHLVGHKDDDANNKTFQIWQIASQIANIVAIIALLVIILSQATGLGISNYGVKKMLPKLIVAVILINLSFFAIRLLVEVSNIVGSGLYNTLINITGLKIHDTNLVNSAVMKASFWNDFINSALDIITLIVMSFLWAIAIIVQLFVMVGRDAALILATVFAPIAVVLYTMPNTQKIVSFWARTIGFALLLYPMMALIFGVSRIAFLISQNTDSGFINGLISHTMLILPFLISPFIVVKTGKFVPMIGGLVSKASKWSNGLLTGKMPAPKEGGMRYYRLQRKQAATDLANRGELKGRFWRYPGQSIKSEIIRRTGYATSKFGAEQTIKSRGMQSAKREQIANSMSLEDAESILSQIRGGAKAPKLDKSKGVVALQLSGVTTSEMVLAASLARAKYRQQNGMEFDRESHAQAMNFAKQRGASQADLQDAHRQTEGVFKGSNDFSATGALKGMETYWRANPDANGDVWGNYNATDWANPTSDVNLNQRNAIRSDMVHQVLEPSLDSSGIKVTLDASVMSSLAMDVFTKEYHSNEVFRGAIHEQVNSWSAETYATINTAVGGVLPSR